MQCVHRLGDRIKPAIVDEVSLVVVRVDCVRDIGDLAVAVVRAVLMVVGCDILPAVDWAVIIMEVVHSLCLAIGSRKLWHCRPLLHCMHLLYERVLVGHWHLMRLISR